MSKNKKIFISVLIIVLLIILLVIFSPKLVKRLTGSVAGAQKEVKNEQVNEVCNKDITSDYFITLSGKIIQDFGDEGTALITIRNDNMVLTKEVTVKSNEYTNFNYVLPRDNYDVTVTKAGYETYETQIKQSTNLDITLHSSEMVIAVSNRVFYNVYYDFYTDGTIHLKTIGNFNANDDGVVTKLEPFLLTNIFIEYLNSKNFDIDFSFKDDTTGLGKAFFTLISSVIASGQTVDNVFSRQIYVDAYQKIESGECNANNMLDESCGFDDIVFNEEGNLNNSDFTFDYARRFIKAIVDMPVPTNLIIDDSVAVLPSLVLITSPEVTINNNILYASPSTFSSAKIGSFTVNSNVLAQTESFAVESKINNLVIGEGVTSIGKKAFDDATIDNITLPNTLTEIGTETFRDSNINAIVIPESVETIGRQAFYNSSLTEVKLQEGLKTIEMNAFYGTKLTSITIPDSVASIGERAFSNTPLTEVIIEGDQTRFNSNWTRIGFPESLKPSE